jgi:hypothetical protein
MTKNIPLDFSPFPSKVLLAISTLIIWICALALLIYCCPQYVPDYETLLFSDFESKPQIDVRTGRLFIKPWDRVSPGIIWEPTGGFAGSAGIKLVADAKNKSRADWVCANPWRFSFLEFRGRMRSENSIRDGRTARFLVYFTSAGKAHWDYPHVAGTVSGTSSWKEFVKIFPVPDFSDTAHVVIENISKSGTVWCDDILLRSVHVNPAYLLYRQILIISGIVIFIAVIIIFGLWKGRGWIPLGIMTFIITGVIFPNNYLKMLAGSLDIEITLLKKFGHASLFFILGMVSIWCLAARLQSRDRASVFLPYLALVFGGLLLFAALTEFLQFITFDRGPGIFDLVIDTSCIVTGIALACFLKTQMKK